MSECSNSLPSSHEEGRKRIFTAAHEPVTNRHPVLRSEIMGKPAPAMLVAVALESSHHRRTAMKSTTARRYRIALASLALAGLCCGTAGAAGVGVGTPANSGSLMYDEAHGGIRTTPSMRSDTGGIHVGVPANSGSLMYDEAHGGIRSTPSTRSQTGAVGVGVPANSGSLMYNEAQGGIREKPNMRTETGQSAASLQQ